MSFVIAVPEFVASAATDLSNIGSGLSAANAAAVAPTTAVVAAAGDEVSAAIASLFSGHAKEFQALGARGGVSCRVCAGVEWCGGRVFADRGGQRLAVRDRRA